MYLVYLVLPITGTLTLVNKVILLVLLLFVILVVGGTLAPSHIVFKIGL